MTKMGLFVRSSDIGARLDSSLHILRVTWGTNYIDFYNAGSYRDGELDSSGVRYSIVTIG